MGASPEKLCEIEEQKVTAISLAGTKDASEEWGRTQVDHFVFEMLAAEGLSPWPEADPALVTDATVTIAIQVAGKMRGRVDLPAGVDQETATAAALAVDNVAATIADREVRKVIFVPDRLVNFVV